MATNNAINISTGTTGQLLVATTGTTPSFASVADGNFTFTSSTASTTRQLIVQNTDNTAAATSAANLLLAVGGANVGDPSVTWTVTGVQSYSMGIDNSDSDKFKISGSTALGTTDMMAVTTAGEFTYPLQPCFYASNSAADSNVTGDGTVYTVIFDSEIFDQNNDYNNATGVFTAPVTGRYFFAAGVLATNLGAGHTDGNCALVASNRTLVSSINSPGAIRNNGNQTGLGITSYVDMDSGDTASVTVTISNSTLTVGVAGNSAPTEFTFFSGQLAV